MCTTNRAPRWLLAGLAALLAGVGALAYVRAARLKYDFHHFYLDAAYVWRHGTLNRDFANPDPAKRPQLPFYLPAVPLLLSPLTAGGVRPAAAMWTAGHLIALAYSLRVMKRWGQSGAGPQSGTAPLVAGTLLALPAIYEAARFNQLSFVVLALVLAGVSAVEQNRPLRAGAWLGLATALKLLPLVFALWLVLKRRWTALGMLLGTVLVVALAPCLVVLGPRATVEHHRQWWEYNVRGAPARGLLDARLREHFLDHRNQSISAVVARLAWSAHPHPAPLRLAALDERACRQVALALSLLLLAGLVWLSRGCGAALGPRGLKGAALAACLRYEAAAYCLAMLILAPLLRTYYLVWALPGLVLLARQALDGSDRRTRRLGGLGLLVWLLGMLGWLSDAARACGVHLLMALALAGTLLALARAYSLRKITQAL